MTYDHATRTARVITSRGTAKVRNVERAASPVVAVGQVDGRRWSTLEGVATVRYDAEAVRDAEARYTARYRRPRANPERVVVEIAVRRFLGTVRPGREPPGPDAADRASLGAGRGAPAEPAGPPGDGADVPGQRRTSRERTTSVSRSTPKATMKAICSRKASGITPRAAKVAASTTPAR